MEEIKYKEILLQASVVAEAESEMLKAEHRKEVIKDLFKVDLNQDTLDMFMMAVKSYNKAKELYDNAVKEYKYLVAKAQQK